MIIDDSTDLSKISDPNQRGLQPRDFTKEPIASSPVARAVDYSTFRCESDEERKDLIRVKEKNHATNEEMAADGGFRVPKFQAFSNWCWAGSSLMAFMGARAKQGLPFVDFSIASVAGPASNWSSVPPMQGRPIGVGGWCSQSMQWLVKHGAVPVDQVPDIKMSRQAYTEEVKAIASQYRVVGQEFDDLQPRNANLMIDYLIKVGPCAAAFMWMSHAVAPWDAVILQNGAIGVRCRNTGYLRDEKGYTILSGNKMIPDEIVGIRQVTK